MAIGMIPLYHTDKTNKTTIQTSLEFYYVEQEVLISLYNRDNDKVQKAHFVGRGQLKKYIYCHNSH